jgi:uncharacterized protein (UPF0332 family)
VKEHTQLLLDKAERAIRAARVLLEADETEFAAGRVYYAMLYVAEALLYERDLVLRKHSAVHAAFGREFAKPGLLDPKYHRWLLTAFDARLQGDYQVVSSVTDQDLETGLEQAQEFLAVARSFLAVGRGRG